MSNKNLYIIYCLVAITVFFNESSYSVVESTGVVQPTLLLSNLSSTDININIFELAFGEY